MKTYDAIVNCKANDRYLIDDGVRSTNKDFRNTIDAILRGLTWELGIKTIEETDLNDKILDIIKMREEDGSI